MVTYRGEFGNGLPRRYPLLGRCGDEDFGEEDSEELPAELVQPEAPTACAWLGDIEAQRRPGAEVDCGEAAVQNIDGAASVRRRHPAPD